MSLFAAALVGVVSYLLGFTHAWTRQAFQDWKTRKKQMRTQRTLFFTGVRQFAQYSAMALLLIVALVAYVARGRAGGESAPEPAPGCSAAAEPAVPPSSAAC